MLFLNQCLRDVWPCYCLRRQPACILPCSHLVVPSWFCYTLADSQKPNRNVIDAGWCTLTQMIIRCIVGFASPSVKFRIIRSHSPQCMSCSSSSIQPHGPDQFCMFRLQCILTRKLVSASMLFLREVLVRVSTLRLLVLLILLCCSKC